VETCRAATVELPSYACVRGLLLEEATRAQVLAINHDLNPDARDHGLRQWALERNIAPQLEWFELSGAASASLAVHALFALAAEPAVSPAQAIRVHGAYFPWISAATTMLDSYVDQAEDKLNGDHSYIAHYPTQDAAARRTCELTRRSLQEAGGLPDAERHILIVSCMVALYLSKDSVRGIAPQGSLAILKAGGTLTRVLRPILRMWRIIYSQRAV
jgi:tetraprenyl-beta-curcumene synthase